MTWYVLSALDVMHYCFIKSNVINSRSLPWFIISYQHTQIILFMWTPKLLKY